jgi:hypothetical protein
MAASVLEEVADLVRDHRVARPQFRSTPERGNRFGAAAQLAKEMAQVKEGLGAIWPDAGGLLEALKRFSRSSLLKEERTQVNPRDGIARIAAGGMAEGLLSAREVLPAAQDIAEVTGSGRVITPKPQSLSKTGLRLRHSPSLSKGKAEVVVCLGICRAVDKGLTEYDGLLVGSAQRTERLSEEEARVECLGLAAQELAVFSAGRIELSEVLQRAGEVDTGGTEVRTELYSGAERRQSLSAPPALIETGAQVVVGLGVIGCELRRPSEAGDGPLVVTVTGENQTEAHMASRVVRLKSDRTFNEADGVGVQAGLLSDQTE